MKQSSAQAVFRALNEAGVRYLVAGGLAVNAHGYLRFTNDVDFVIQLVPDNIIRAFNALEQLGYKPKIPVTAEQFADKNLRESWIREKNMQVLPLWSETHIETPIDIFVQEPFDFEAEYKDAMIKELAGGGGVRFVNVETLIRMKEQAGRSQDMVDIQQIKLGRGRGSK